MREAGDSGQHVGQPGPGIDVVQLGGDDQGTLGGIVAEADSAVGEEAGEAGQRA